MLRQKEESQLRGAGVGGGASPVADARQGRAAVTPGSLPHDGGSDRTLNPQLKFKPELDFCLSCLCQLPTSSKPERQAQSAMPLRERVLTGGMACPVLTPLANKVLECAEGLYWSPLRTQPPKTAPRETWSYCSQTRPQPHMPPCNRTQPSHRGPHAFGVMAPASCPQTSSLARGWQKPRFGSPHGPGLVTASGYCTPPTIPGPCS